MDAIHHSYFLYSFKPENIPPTHQYHNIGRQDFIKLSALLRPAPGKKRIEVPDNWTSRFLWRLCNLDTKIEAMFEPDAATGEYVNSYKLPALGPLDYALALEKFDFGGKQFSGTSDDCNGVFGIIEPTGFHNSISNAQVRRHGLLQ